MKSSQSVKRVCIDLTPLEMIDRHGGIGRYTVHLLRQCLELPASETEGLEFFGLTRSFRKPMPGAIALREIERLEEVMSTRWHRRCRRHVMGLVLRSGDIDLFHSTEPGVQPHPWGFRMVSTIYDVIPVVMPNRTGNPWLVRRRNERERRRMMASYGSGEHAIAISACTKKDMIEHLHIPEARISVVHLGVDTEAFACGSEPVERERLVAKHDLPQRWFICVGSDHYRKNHQRLFDAWCKVAGRIPEGLVFVGRPLYASTLQTIQQTVRQLGLEQRFRWISTLGDDELPPLYRHATAAVAPSLYEGFGMTLLEAMACGAPVAAARNGAYEEVAAQAAVYFDPYSVDDIASSLVRLSEDAALLATLRDQGLARAREKSWTQMARETVAVYRKILGQGGG